MVLAHNINEGIRTQDIQITQDVTFDSMLLTANTLQGLKSSGFYKPSPVQLHGIPLGKCGFDLLLEAKSGTGKTAVFSVIALEKLDIDNGVQVLILAPTREIAHQIYDVIQQLGANYSGLVVEVVMGGLPVAEDVAKFRKKVHIVVGSPGRLRHLIQDCHIDISSVRLLVLDEADKLMEKSFLQDINYIFSILPAQKQVIMSSATYPESTKNFIKKYVKSAQHVCPNSNCILLGVDQKITVVKSNTNIVRQTQYRFEELLKILSHRQFKQCLIFCNYQARVKELYKLLMKEKWPVEQLCARQEQSDRLDALKTLQEYKCRILISTDLASRGIDASNVDLVINFEPPFEWQTYLHRIGRAGRYGSYGMAITILGEGKEENSFKQLLESINFESLKVTQFWPTKTCESIQNLPHTATVPISTDDFANVGFKTEYNNIWKTLCDNSSNNIEIEDFESLCKSFNESKQPNIESFTDLMNSYQRHPVEQSTYQCIRSQSIVNNYFFELMKSLITNPSHETNIKINKITVKDNNDNDIHTESIHKDHKRMQIHTDTNSHQKNFEVGLKYSQHSQYSECGENEAESSSKALLDAGLPQCFMSKKNMIGKGNSKELYKERKISENNYKQIPKNNFKLTLNTAKNKCKKSLEDTYDHSHKNSNSKGANYYQREASCSTNERVNVGDQYSQDYIHWFKELKTRVKHLELAIYIDEISRL